MTEIVNEVEAQVAAQSEVQAATPPPRARQVWVNDDARRFRRFVEDLGSVGISAKLFCDACCEAQGKYVEITAARAVQTGELLLQCPCTVRILRGVQ